MSVPFKLFGGCVGLRQDHVEHGGNAAGNRHVRERQTVSHRVAQTDLHRRSAACAEFIELIDHRNDEPFEVGSCRILQVAARTDPVFQRRFHNFLIRIQRLSAGLAQFQKDMIIGARRQNSGLLQSHLPDQFEVFFGRADPCGDLGEFVSEFPAGLHRLAVLFAVQEEFALTDHSAFPADAVHEPEKFDDFGNGVRRSGLLTVPEGRICDPELLRKAGFHGFPIQFERRNLVIGKYFPKKIRLGNVFQQSFHDCWPFFPVILFSRSVDPDNIRWISVFYKSSFHFFSGKCDCIFLLRC